MSVETSAGTMLASTPSVNLLPPEILEAARFRRYQAGMGAVVLAAAAVVGLLYSGAHHSADSAHSSLVSAQAQERSMQAQTDALSSVSAVYNQADSQKALVSQAMGSAIRWSYYFDDLSLRIPDGVWLTSMNITPSGATAGATTTTTTTTGPLPTSIAPANPVSTIQFTGYALSQDDVAKWLNAIAAEKGWADPYVNTISESTIGPRTVETWTGTVYVTSTTQSGHSTDTTGS